MWLFALACAVPVPDDTGPPIDTDPAEETDDTNPPDPDTDPVPDTDDTDVPDLFVSGDLVFPAVRIAGSDEVVDLGVRGDSIVGWARPRASLPAGVTVVESARGAVIAPGLIDPHVHLTLSGAVIEPGGTLDDALAATLAAGITTVLDAGGPAELWTLRDRIAAGEVLGPTVLATGPFVTTPGSHPCEVINDPDRCWFVDDDASARAVGAALRDGGADAVKLALADASFTPWPAPRLDPDLAAVVVGAAARPLVLAHVDTAEDALDALDAGATVLAHPVFAPALTSGEAAEIASRAGAVHTTLGAFAGTADLLDGSLLADADGHVPDAILADWREVAADPDAWLGAGWTANSAAWAAAARAHLQTLGDAGANWVPASDAGYVFVPHGLGLHRELDRLVAMGFTDADVFRAATVGAAASLGLDDRGVIAVGARADLIVLDADPTKDVRAARSPRLVLLGGTIVDRDGPVVVLPRAGRPTDACVTDDDCVDSVCDPFLGRCAETCPTAWAVSEPCGSDATCWDAGTPLCRPLPTCAPYDHASCEPSWYAESCLPWDKDTWACTASGPRALGETCDNTFAATQCVSGAFCGTDRRCYAVCDPADGPCDDGSTCVPVRIGATTWYGWCRGT